MCYSSFVGFYEGLTPGVHGCTTEFSLSMFKEVYT